MDWTRFTCRQSESENVKIPILILKYSPEDKAKKSRNLEFIFTVTSFGSPSFTGWFLIRRLQGNSDMVATLDIMKINYIAKGVP